MATTAIVAEILIVGLEAATWVSLLVLAIFGTGWIHLGALAHWEGLATIVVLAAAYVLGILVDRAADTAHGLLERRWPGPPVDKPAGISRMRMTVLSEGGAMSTFVDYQRSRLRIARATVLNLFVALPVLVVFLAVRTDLGWLTAVVAGLLALSVALAELAYRLIEFAYVNRLSDAYRLVKKLPKADLAAAVPYRLTDDGLLEFLFVRTKGGDRWTFPKGHRKRGETLPRTAAREACEEAGVKGRVEGKRLAGYLYPPGSRPGREEDYRVAAFLLEKRKEGLPRTGADAGREVVWKSAEEAGKLLEEGRTDKEQKYADEMKRVLDAALEVIEQRIA